MFEVFSVACAQMGKIKKSMYFMYYLLLKLRGRDKGVQRCVKSIKPFDLLTSKYQKSVYYQMPPPTILKRRHTLRGKNLLPVIKKLRGMDQPYPRNFR